MGPGYQCDGCLTFRPQAEVDGWIMMGRLFAADAPVIFTPDSEEYRAKVAAHKAHPLGTARYFCSEVCASSWLANGMQSVLVEASE